MTFSLSSISCSGFSLKERIAASLWACTPSHPLYGHSLLHMICEAQSVTSSNKLLSKTSPASPHLLETSTSHSMSFEESVRFLCFNPENQYEEKKSRAAGTWTATAALIRQAILYSLEKSSTAQRKKQRSSFFDELVPLLWKDLERLSPSERQAWRVQPAGYGFSQEAWLHLATFMSTSFLPVSWKEKNTGAYTQALLDACTLQKRLHTFHEGKRKRLCLKEAGTSILTHLHHTQALTSLIEPLQAFQLLSVDGFIHDPTRFSTRAESYHTFFKAFFTSAYPEDPTLLSEGDATLLTLGWYHATSLLFDTTCGEHESAFTNERYTYTMTEGDGDRLEHLQHIWPNFDRLVQRARICINTLPLVTRYLHTHTRALEALSSLGTPFQAQEIALEDGAEVFKLEVPEIFFDSKGWQAFLTQAALEHSLGEKIPSAIPGVGARKRL